MMNASINEQGIPAMQTWNWTGSDEAAAGALRQGLPHGYSMRTLIFIVSRI
ncbi:MAG: hypothetical protein HYV36_05995 [Lentisphaerae bacterium]|nr:hypothetical protein [Lentisphaerota bacterium]